MLNIAVLGYGVSVVAGLALSLLLATAWRGRQEGGFLLAATLMSMLWSALAAYQADSGYVSSLMLVAAELARDAAWLVFLIVVIAKGRPEGIANPFLRSIAIFSSLLLVAVAVVLALVYSGIMVPSVIGFEFRIFVFLVLSLLGLVLVEQLFRNTALTKRWAIKYLCLGLGGMFAYDFYLYSDALLLRSLDMDIWAARGFISAMVVPLIAVSAARNPQWSLDVFVSRSFVFHSSALLGAGLYLLAMAAGGYYISVYGGDWGGAVQVVFFFGAGLMLLMLMFSGQMRARLRIFLSKHFFNYRYDYREEWLRFIATLSETALDAELRPRVVSAIAQIVESPGGILWQRQANDNFQPVAGWNMPEDIIFKPADNRSLLLFFRARSWVINLDEVAAEPESYVGLELPAWLNSLPNAWLIVPLFNMSNLDGFIILARPRADLQINWEVRDLLMTTGRQAASYLALLDANEALVDARQFEAFNRLSAYVVHDLKNLVAQLSLVVSNSARHRGNPEFVEDAFSTVDHAVKKMNRLLAQLRKGKIDGVTGKSVDLRQLLEEVVMSHSGNLPVPQMEKGSGEIRVVADTDRLSAIIGHLIDNAQDATADDGVVSIRLGHEEGRAIVEISDTGSGMDAQFIRDRLFRPFDTTKGNAGMGIGVYESREFITNLGGSIDVQSTLGQGTTFRITLNLENNKVDAPQGSAQITATH